MSTIETAAGDAADRVVRIPANLMGLLHQSYDSRQKVLDWMLAIGTVALLAWAFREQITAVISPPLDDPDAGLNDPAVPNMDLAGAFPASGKRPDLYTYNMPGSRIGSHPFGPTVTRMPRDPSTQPTYAE
jgi:hypothetical protein